MYCFAATSSLRANNRQKPAGETTARACPVPVPPALPGGRDGEAQNSYYCLSLRRLRWQTILSHCFVATSSLRANCLVAMRSPAVSLIPHERNPRMQRCRIQKTESAESERRNARLGNGTWMAGWGSAKFLLLFIPPSTPLANNIESLFCRYVVTSCQLPGCYAVFRCLSHST